VAIVDDDESVRDSLPDLLQELGFATRAFGSAEDFLASDALEPTRCVILDVVMPGMSGPELHRKLLHLGNTVPVIFITAQAGEALRPALLSQGAVACLCKPFTELELRTALAAAFRWS
jgi:FixJ family two-component response regulator